MNVGDLAETVKGNIVLIVKAEAGWCNILFTTTGYLRIGYPREWLRSLKCK